MTIHLHPHNPLFSQWSSTPELAIIDSGVDQLEHLRQGLKPNTEVRLLDSNQDGVIQITQILQEVRAKRVHIVSHGSPGCLYLGNTQLNLNTLKRYQEQVKTWNVPLMLYGCRVAATETGQRFVQQLEEITGVTVKASAERVGNISFGGTWNLMWSTPWLPKVMATYPGVFDPSPSPEPTPLNFEETWKFGIFGTGIGQSGLITADIDNDGTIEILANGSNSTFGSSDFWYVLEPSPEDGQYYTQWMSDLESDKITTIAAFDSDRDGIYSIFVGLDNGNIAVYDGSSLEPTAHIESPADSINHILLADADNDSDQELVFTDNDGTFIYNLSSLNLENEIAYGANDFEVGNVDEDREQEIIFSSGQVLEFDGTETTVEWEYGGGDFGALVELSDIDSDGMKEIIGASSWYHLTAFDADIQSPKWQLNADLDIDALLVTDIDDDGIEDILYGDGQWGSIYAYDPVTLTKTWEIDNPDHGVTDK